MSKWFEEILRQLAAYNSPLFKNELVMNAFKQLIQMGKSNSFMLYRMRG